MNRVEDGHEQMTEDEEKIRLAAEQAQRDQADAEEREAIKTLKKTPLAGEVPASFFRIQITGGEVTLPPDQAAKCRRDAEVEVTLKGWIKTVKETTESRGGKAARVAVLVVDEVVGEVEPAQLELDVDGGDS